MKRLFVRFVYFLAGLIGWTVKLAQDNLPVLLRLVFAPFVIGIYTWLVTAGTCNFYGWAEQLCPPQTAPMLTFIAVAVTILMCAVILGRKLLFKD